MTEIHAQLIGDKAVLARSELEKLVELARHSEEISLQVQEEDEVPTWSLMQLAEQGRAFDFWHDVGEDIYSLEDGEPV